MKDILVDKAKLIETLRKNRENHREQFLKAQEKYRETVIKELDKRLEAAREGGPINLGFRLPEPEDYTDDYDTAIAMLEWDVDEQVSLTHQDFERYVLNQWAWARQFAANTQSYLAQ